jgi:hypothetical protein
MLLYKQGSIAEFITHPKAVEMLGAVNVLTMTDAASAMYVLFVCLFVCMSSFFLSGWFDLHHAIHILSVSGQDAWMHGGGEQ